MLNNYLGNSWPNEEQTLLLHAALLSGRPAEDAWQSWKARIDFDKIDYASYKLLPLVARNSDLESLQDPIFEKCKGIYRRNWVSNQLNWGKLLPILDQLTKAGVNKIVLLKGMAMILSFYRDFGMRVIGDVDILIEREQLPIAAPFLRESGWEQTYTRIDEKNQEHLKKWHALNFTHPNGLLLDLHWSFIQENSPAMDLAVLRDATPLKNLGLYVPSPTDLLLQTCIHGVKYSPVPLIRWVADAMSILKTSEQPIQWDRFIELANYAHICRPLYFALQYLVQHFDAPIPQDALLKLQAHPSTRLERLEYQFSARGLPHVAAWYRYCLNRGLLTIRAQILHLHKYLQLTARLKSPWYIPPYVIYWIFRRIYRFIKTN